MKPIVIIEVVEVEDISASVKVLMTDSKSFTTGEIFKLFTTNGMDYVVMGDQFVLMRDSNGVMEYHSLPKCNTGR